MLSHSCNFAIAAKMVVSAACRPTHHHTALFHSLHVVSIHRALRIASMSLSGHRCHGRGEKKKLRWTVSGHRGNGRNKAASDGSAAKVQAASAGSSGFISRPLFSTTHSTQEERESLPSRWPSVRSRLRPRFFPLEHHSNADTDDS